MRFARDVESWLVLADDRRTVVCGGYVCMLLSFFARLSLLSTRFFCPKFYLRHFFFKITESVLDNLGMERSFEVLDGWAPMNTIETFVVETFCCFPQVVR